MHRRKGVPKIGLVLLVAAGLAGAVGCNKLRSRDLINRGVQAYKEAQYDKAEADLRQAAELDPANVDARLFLAAAYAGQFVKGSTAPENIRKGQEAIAQYKKVLEIDPNNLNAISSIGSILFNLGAGPPPNPETLTEAKTWQRKVIALKPDDPTPYYWIGVIDWSMAYRANQDLRQKYNEHLPRRAKPLQAGDPLPEKLRAEFAAKYQQTVDEGIQALQKAIQLKPDYADAVAYLNILDRQKADMAASKDERDALLKEANALANRYNEIQQSHSGAPAPTH